MFDIGFSEIFVIAVVALIVIGPERLPGVARTLGHLFGRMQRYVNEVKSDIQREIELDELKKLRESVEASAREIEQSVSREIHSAHTELRTLETAADPGAEIRGLIENTGRPAAESGASRLPGSSALGGTAPVTPVLEAHPGAGIEDGVLPVPPPSKNA